MDELVDHVLNSLLDILNNVLEICPATMYPVVALLCSGYHIGVQVLAWSALAIHSSRLTEKFGN